MTDKLVFSSSEKKEYVDSVVEELKIKNEKESLEYFEKLKSETFFSYKDFLVLSVRAYNKAGFLDACNKFLKIEYESKPHQDPIVVVCYASSFLPINDIDSLQKLVCDNFDSIESEWIKLELVELLCDAHCWDIAVDKLPLLTYSGNASKSKYLKIKSRIEMSAKYDEATDIDVFYINLDKDSEKRVRIQSHLSSCLKNFTRVPGVLAKNLPHFARERLHRSHVLKKQVGALGCFLAHVNALEKVVENNVEVALIIEDDAFFYYRPSKYVINEILKSGCDLIYVNSRMMKRDDLFETPLNVDPVSSRLSIISDSISGWGGDGYIVTNYGARLLLENFSHDLGLGHYDGQLGAYGLIGVDFPVVNKATKVGMNLVNRFSRKSTRINCGCLDFPLISFKEYGSSSRLVNS